MSASPAVRARLDSWHYMVGLSTGKQVVQPQNSGTWVSTSTSLFPAHPPQILPAIADWRKEITLTWGGRIQYPAMSAFEGASIPYSDQVKENSESMGKEGEKMVKESEFGRLGQKIGCFTSCHRGLHRNRLSVLPPHPLVAWIS